MTINKNHIGLKVFRLSLLALVSLANMRSAYAQEGVVKPSQFVVPKQGKVGFRKMPPQPYLPNIARNADSLLNAYQLSADYTRTPVPELKDSTQQEQTPEFIPDFVPTDLTSAGGRQNDEEAFDPGYSGYLRAGFGNYTSPYAAFFYRSDTRKKANIGLYARHHSAWQGPVDGDHSAFSNTHARLYGTAPTQHGEWYYQGRYRHQLNHWYGYHKPSDEPQNISADSIRQRYHIAGLSMGYRGKSRDRFRWSLGMDGHYLRDRDDVSEYLAGLSFAPVFRLGQPTTLHFGLSGELSAKEDSTLTQDRHLARANLGFRFRKGFFDGYLGAKGVYNPNPYEVGQPFGTADGRFYVFPDAYLHFYLFRNRVGLLLSGKGQLRRNTMEQMAIANPWIAPSVILPHTHEMINARARLQLKLGTWGMIEGGYAYRIWENIPLFSNSDQDRALMDLRIEEQMTIGESHLAITVMEGGWHFYLEGRYAQYTDLQTEQKAWHMPVIEGRARLSYNHRDKLFIRLGYRTMMDMEVRAIVSDDLQTLAPIHDLSLEADYQLTKGFSVFARGHNLLNQDYQRFLFYRVMGINFHGGITLRF